MVNRGDQALACGPVGVETILVGDLNACLVQPQDQRKEDLKTAIPNYGLVEQILYLIPSWGYRGKGGWPWRMWIYERPITGRGD